MDIHPRNLSKLLAAGLLGFTLLTLGLLWASTSARAGGLLYAAPTPSGSADCSTWANVCTLQTALSNAVSGDQIWVQMGVHKPTSTTDRTISFALQPGVEVYGGFTGTEDDLSERDWQANLTVLSGDIDGNDLADPTGVVTDTANINGANSYHVVSAGGTVAETARLDGFAVTAGQADGSDYPHYMGGGMINDASSPTLENMTFSANQAGGAGSGCGGGGIYNYASDLTLRNVTFSANQVSGTGVTCGGGGMYNVVSNPILEKVTFSANQVSGTGWWTGGAGMYNDVSNPILENVIFSGNQAAGTGSGSGGGAIYNMYSHPKLVNVTLAGNYGWPGAALYNMGSAGAGSNPTLTNVIVWGNSPDSGQIWNEGSSTPAVNYSLVQGGYTGAGNLDADPHFVAPLDGSLAPTAAGNYRLLLNSPAIDAGDNSAVTPGVTSDLDGNPRFVDILSVADTGSGTSPIVDLGSYEAFIGVHFAAPAAVGSGDCSTWADACTLQTALSNAVSGEQIWVQMGVHKPTLTTDRTISFALQPGVEVYGGFAGAEDDLSERDWQANLTVLSGDIDGNDLADPTGVVTDTTNIVGDNSYHVVTSGSGITESASLDGFVVTAGLANGASPDHRGGGIHNLGGDPTLVNLILSGNQADSYGGGMYSEGLYNNGSSPTLTGVAFRGNSGGSGGGLANIYYSSPILKRVTFEKNSAVSDGGGLYNREESNPTLTDCLFSENTAAAGAGMYNDIWTDPVLKEVVFDSNHASGSGGGLVAFNSSYPVLDGVTFFKNTAVYGGGMWSYYNVQASIKNTRFIENSATDGGGLYSKETPYHTQQIVNTVFFSNTATRYGGAIYLFRSGIDLINSTLSKNSAEVRAGALYNDYQSGPYLKNSIFWDDQSPSAPEIYNDNSTNVISFSLVAGSGGSGLGWDSSLGTDGGGNLDTDPNFRDPDNGDLRLLLTTPAIDAGDNSLVPVGVTSDLDGNPRFVDILSVADTGSGTSPIVDLGAYEAFIKVHFAAPAAVGSGDCSTWSDACDLQTALASAVSGDQIWVQMGVHKPTSTTDRTISFALQHGVEVYGGFSGTEDDLSERDWQSNLTVLSGDLDRNDLADPTGVVTVSTNIVGDNSYHVVTAGSGITESARLDGFVITAGDAHGAAPHNLGGGMSNTNSSPTVANSLFSGNQAGEGGGMHNFQSSPTLLNVVFSGGKGCSYGCGMANAQSSPLLNRVVFRNNASSYGGAMGSGSNSSPTLINVLFASNSAAENGGAMDNSTGTSPTLINVTFSDNNAGRYGGAIYNYYCTLLTMTNVVMWGNPDLSYYEISSINSPVVATYSLIKYPGGYPGTGNLNTNPLFADANGPDDIFGTTDDDLRLLPGSPAIDAGDNSLVPVEITTDLDGNLRFADDPDTVDTGSGTPPIVDMGAYEAAFSDIELEKEVFPGTVEPGDPITFTLSFTSTGGISAVQVVLTDTIPASVQVSSVISSGVTILDSVHTPAYVWDVQDMAPGAHGVITITGVLHAPLAAGEYSNMASISFGTGAFRADRSDDASWTVPNVAPYFSSTPLTSAAQDELYSYSIAAADGNGDSVAITAPTLPGWLSLTDNGDGTASLSGTPGSSDVGDHVVELEVEDSEGLKGTQGFTIAVANLNDPPEFTSAPVESADEDVLYTYNITASDPDLVHGDTLVITAATLPGWLTLVDNGDGTATLSGTPYAADVGDHAVELEVEDTAGLTDTQSFTIVVLAAPLKEIYLPVIRR